MVTDDQLLAWYERYVGTREASGRNDGVTVEWFQSSTGAYHAAWCVSFLQKGLQMMNVGRIADRTAGVFYLVGWARRVGLLRYYPARGYFCAFLVGQGHIGVVKEVRPDGSFITVEGNHNNSVAYEHRWPNSTTVYIQIPNLKYTGVEKPKPPPKPKAKWVPRFEIVAGMGTKAHVLVGWSKWSTIQLRIPRLVARGQAFRVRRKLVRNV